VDTPVDTLWIVPVYEYACRACGHRLEEVQPMGSGPPGPCPECGGELRRVYGRVAVRFSGWGFSKTDRLASDDRPRKDFRKLKEKADEIRES
jgi:putative FmdB family regulatory protein